MRSMGLIVAMVLMGFVCSCARGAEEIIQPEVGNAVRPRAVQPTEEHVARLKAPQGFKVNIFARELGEPRMMAVGEDGTIYVTRRKPGDVVAMRDGDGDGVAEKSESVVKLPGAHGIAIRDGKMYLATVHEVYVVEMPGTAGGAFGELSKLVQGLPEGGRHPNRTLGFDPEGMLYVTVGSTCNCCMEKSKESASILKVDPKSGKRELWAEGLRNTLGFGWHPKTHVCWGMDHGSDWLGDGFPQEELNRLEGQKHYGWPLLHENNVYKDAIRVPRGVDLQEWKSKSTPITLGYTAHAAPLQMAYYTGEMFPEEYRNDAFVAMRGSWNARPPVGYEVVRIKFDKSSGEPTEIVPFVSGWLIDEKTHMGRLCGVAIAKDGALIVGDDTVGTIWRIAYTSGRR